MSEDLHVDFVLVRGPQNVARRLHVVVPADGTPVTLGRCINSGAVLDPWLTFASQTQCSLFCVAPTAEASSSAAADDCTTGACLQTPVRQPLPHLFITDLCSSNGTFVNKVRLSATEPFPLHDGDDCVFGGMRDVDVGESLPVDAFDGPELVVWRVDVLNGKDAPSAFDVERTPLVLPRGDVLGLEEKALMDTALQYLKQATTTTTSEVETTPAAGSNSSLPATPEQLQPAALFTDTTPATTTLKGRRSTQTAATTEPPTTTEAPASGPGEETELCRTTCLPSVLALGEAPIDTTDAVDEIKVCPPPPVYFHAVRIGAHTCHVPDAALMGTQYHHHHQRQREELEMTAEKEKKKHAEMSSMRKSRRVERPRKEESKMDEGGDMCDPVYALRFTNTHLKWAMEKPGIHVSSSSIPGIITTPPPQSYLLPIASVSTIFTCRERLGIAMELRPNACVPLVPPALLTGAENRWLVWLLEEHQSSATAASQPQPPPLCAPPRLAPRSHKRPRTSVVEGPELAAWDADLEEATAGFDRWCGQVRGYCAALRVSAPHPVDTVTFDSLFAPTLTTKDALS